MNEEKNVGIRPDTHLPDLEPGASQNYGIIKI